VEEASKKPESRNLPILAHLMHPVQRVCKYPLLLQAILKHTPENHPDYAVSVTVDCITKKEGSGLRLIASQAAERGDQGG
jgi:hypothetical protein